MEKGSIGQLRKHLRGALRMTQIRKLVVAGGLQCVIHLFCCVILAVFVKTIIKELLRIGPGVMFHVAATVNIPSVVAGPDVVAVSSQRLCK